MNRKNFHYILAASIVCAMVINQAHAGSGDPELKPAVVRHMLQFAGIQSDIIESSPLAGYPAFLHIANLSGSNVLIAFPARGIAAGSPFMLEIDGMLATVSYSCNKLQFVSGDRRIVEQGIFGTLECIFNEVFSMLAEVVDAILSLDILRLIKGIVSGILGVVICILY